MAIVAPPATLRAVIYSRVSTLMQARQGYSLDAQDTDCDRLADELGASVLARFTDNDSGAEWDLPGLNAVLDMARRREFDMLIVNDPDRLARSLAKQLVLEKNGLPDAYVRPLAWRGSEMMGVSARTNTMSNSRQPCCCAGDQGRLGL